MQAARDSLVQLYLVYLSPKSIDQSEADMTEFSIPHCATPWLIYVSMSRRSGGLRGERVPLKSILTHRHAPAKSTNVLHLRHS